MPNDPGMKIELEPIKTRDRTVAETGAMTVAINIFTAPGEALAAIRERPRFWLPLLLTLLGAGLVGFLYMNGVDLAWFYEEQIRLAQPDLTDAQIENVVTAASSTPPVVIASIAAVTSMLAIAILYLLYALYFKIVSLVLKDGVTFKLWFALACWCSLPSLLRAIASAVNLLTNDVSLMPQTALNPLSFVNLFGLESGGTGRADQIAMNLDPTSIWTLVLLIIGYNAWTRKGIALSVVVATAPYLLVIGIALAV